MPAYGPAVLDILARAYDRALEALPPYDAHDPETARSMLLSGILDAAKAGVRDEKALIVAALNRFARFDAGELEAAESRGRRYPISL